MTVVSLVVPYYMVNDTVWAILSDSHNICIVERETFLKTWNSVLDIY